MDLTFELMHKGNKSSIVDATFPRYFITQKDEMIQNVY